MMIKKRIKSYLFIYVFAAVLIGISISLSIFFNYNFKTFDVVVTGTERVVTSDNDSKYLVFCQDIKDKNKTYVFENTDSLFNLKFNSSDVQAKLVKDGEFRIKVNGVRFAMFSWYQNIISVENLA